jgi:hypothetical protein
MIQHNYYFMRYLILELVTLITIIIVTINLEVRLVTGSHRRSAVSFPALCQSA